MSAAVPAAPGSFEPAWCITPVPVRSPVASAGLVIVIVMVWAVLVAIGGSPEVVTAGLAMAATLGVRVTGQLAQGAGGADA